MSFSLADYILAQGEQKKRREPLPAGGWRPPAANGESPLAEGEVSASPVAKDDFHTSCVAEITRLLAEAAREWSEVEKAIEELRAALKPATFSEALSAAGLGAVGPGGSGPGAVSPNAGGILAVGSGAGAAEKGEARRLAASGRRGSIERSSNAESKASPKPQERPAIAASRGTASEGMAAGAPSRGAAPATKQPEDLVVNAKLEEVLKLLKEHVAAKAAGAAPPPIEIPQKFAHSIAREVAGRLRESVLSSLQAAKPGVPEAPLTAAEAAAHPAPVPVSEPKRIPLGDIAGIIDQLINKQ